MVVVLHHAEIRHMRSWEGQIGRSITRLAKEMVWRQKTLANRRTGYMAGRMHYKKGGKGGNLQFDAGSSAKYTLYPDQGTAPHPIRPRKPGGYLVFFWPKVGHVVFLKSVRHPGNRAYQFLVRGAVAAMRMWARGG